MFFETPGFDRWDYACTSPSDTVLTSFLATLEVTLKELQEVRVVREISDVFEEIPGPPPKREVEFRINLAPGTYPIAKSFYRLAPKKLEEMKK